jgi:hypothetical protein
MIKYENENRNSISKEEVSGNKYLHLSQPDENEVKLIMKDGNLFDKAKMLNEKKMYFIKFRIGNIKIVFLH